MAVSISPFGGLAISICLCFQSTARTPLLSCSFFDNCHECNQLTQFSESCNCINCFPNRVTVACRELRIGKFDPAKGGITEAQARQWCHTNWNDAESDEMLHCLYKRGHQPPVVISDLLPIHQSILVPCVECTFGRPPDALCMWRLAPPTWCESTALAAWCPDTTNNCAIACVMPHNGWMAQSAGAVVSAMEPLQSTRTQTRAILRLLAFLIANYSACTHSPPWCTSPGTEIYFTILATCPKCDHALSSLRVWLFPSWLMFVDSHPSPDGLAECRLVEINASTSSNWVKTYVIATGTSVWVSQWFRVTVSWHLAGAILFSGLFVMFLCWASLLSASILQFNCFAKFFLSYYIFTDFVF